MYTFIGARGTFVTLRWEPSVNVSAEAVSAKVCWIGDVVPATELLAGRLGSLTITDGKLPGREASAEIEWSFKASDGRTHVVS